MNAPSLLAARPLVRPHRYRVEFPPPGGESLDQHEAAFDLVEDGTSIPIRFHDYAAIYARPGLYEQLFYDRLKCTSPAKVTSTLESAVTKIGERMSELRVLDLGAGNGMVGERLTAIGICRLVGLDILPEARESALRDRPGHYDDYRVEDVTAMDDGTRRDLESWNFNCLMTVAALGFGDIPPEAFLEAVNLIDAGGWVAFNIRDSFLEPSETSGFSRMIRTLILSSHLELHHMERYRHRLSIDGEPLNYFAIVARKCEARIPDSVLPG